MTKDLARTVVDVVADGLVRQGVTFILGQSVPTALVLACEDRGIRDITYSIWRRGAGFDRSYAAADYSADLFVIQGMKSP